MYAGVKDVKPLPNYELHLLFEDGTEKIFDVKPYLDTGLFAELKEEKLFNTVHKQFDTVEWNNGVDICPEVLYEESRTIH
jgi:hypothetical protein